MDIFSGFVELSFSSLSTSVSPLLGRACCTHGRSHTRSPGMSITRVDNEELPPSALPVCQMLPCHLGTPTFSINLYVKGCLKEQRTTEPW